MLRNLQKCQACGFPVSQGRTFCVECEEKQWRGQRLPQLTANAVSAEASVEPASEPAKENATPALEISAAATPDPPAATAIDPTPPAAHLELASTSDIPNPPPDAPTSDNSALFLSSAVPSESWFRANKYILAALLVVAIVIAAIAWLR
jgi:hypothetical protein